MKTKDEIVAMTEEEALKHINNLTRYEMCRFQRFAEIGHPYFISDTVLGNAFEARYNALGGMSPAISKQLGRDR